MSFPFLCSSSSFSVILNLYLFPYITISFLFILLSHPSFPPPLALSCSFSILIGPCHHISQRPLNVVDLRAQAPSAAISLRDYMCCFLIPLSRQTGKSVCFSHLLAVISFKWKNKSPGVRILRRCEG